MTAAELIKAVADRFPEAVPSSHDFRGDATVVVIPSHLVEIARFVKDDAALQMNLLVDLSAVDYYTFARRPTPAFFASSGIGVRPSTQIPDQDPWPGPVSKERFTVVYHFYSTAKKHRLRMVVPVGEAVAEVDSVAGLWPGANWLEREVWDMFGIKFRNHPDLRRILMYPEFQGHPLRKDFPVTKRQPLIGPKN